MLNNFDSFFLKKKIKNVCCSPTICQLIWKGFLVILVEEDEWPNDGIDDHQLIANLSAFINLFPNHTNSLTPLYLDRGFDPSSRITIRYSTNGN